MVRFLKSNPVSAATPAVAIALPFDSFGLFVGNLGHHLQRGWLHLLQILSGPKVVSHLWHWRCTRIRIFFSTRSASGLMGVVHSPGSRVKPYFANSARALSSCIAPLVAAVLATLVLSGLVLFGSIG